VTTLPQNFIKGATNDARLAFFSIAEFARLMDIFV
jgi:hypothetical protein